MAAQSTGMTVKRQALSRTIRLRPLMVCNRRFEEGNSNRRPIGTFWRDKGDSCKNFGPSTHKMVTSEVTFATVIFIRKGTGSVRSTATPDKKGIAV